MRTFTTVAAFASAANALVSRSDCCCFGLSATGSESGPIGQLDDGQCRVYGGGLPHGEFCIDSEGGIKDGKGRGCILTEATTQFQCDEGANPTPGFSVGKDGKLLYKGEKHFVACKTGQNGGLNLYTTDSEDKTGCQDIELIADTCYNSPSSPQGPGESSSPPSGGESSYPPSGPESSSPPSGGESSYPPSGGESSYPPSGGESSSVPPGGGDTSSTPGGGYGSSTPPHGGSSSYPPSGGSSSYPPTYGSSSAPLGGYSSSIPPGYTTSTVRETEVVTVPCETSSPGPTHTTAPSRFHKTTTPSSGHSSKSETPKDSPTGFPGLIPGFPGLPGLDGLDDLEGLLPKIPGLPDLSGIIPGFPGGPSESETSKIPTPPEQSPEPVPSHGESSKGDETSTAPHGGETDYPSGGESTYPSGGESTKGDETSTAPHSGETNPSGGETPGSGGDDTPDSPGGGDHGGDETPGSPGGGETPKPGDSTGDCPTDLSGDYEYPHLIVPIDSSKPNDIGGTSYNGEISSTKSTVFNFDILPSDAGRKCSLVFLFPKLEDLETSSYTFKGDGKLGFCSLNSPAEEDTNYNNVPAVKEDYGDITVSPGNSYVISTFDCPAGETVGYKIDNAGSTELTFFEDYNPSPLGLYITVC
ncbi:hypothetical protein FQN54_001818 [Arachnomyces sp. PD_36]|nr:hypothetical protein FQN54_001818 [Arachnomyces sp. PD_36]